MNLAIIYTSVGQSFLEPSEGESTFGLENLFYAKTTEDIARGARQLATWFEEIENPIDQLRLLRVQTGLMFQTANNREGLSPYRWRDPQHQLFLREFSQTMSEFGITYARLLLAGDHPPNSMALDPDNSAPQFLATIFDTSDQALTDDFDEPSYGPMDEDWQLPLSSLIGINFLDFWDFPIRYDVTAPDIVRRFWRKDLELWLRIQGFRFKAKQNQR